MNPNISRLADIARKENRLILGLMSGTSLDGLDIALCRISGSGKGTNVKLLQFTTLPYPDRFREDILKIFSKSNIDFQWLCILHTHIGTTHARMINETLRKWNISATEIDLIASHGQTVFHAPRSLHAYNDYPDATLQIGDGDHIAWETGIITVSDFRQKHVAAGGEGAPLAVYGDYLLFSSTEENRILLNLGGIANFTFLPIDGQAEKVFTTDVGPSNTLIDAYCRKHLNCSYDEDGRIAHSGNKNDNLLAALMAHDFFRLPVPKSTGPELFNLDYLAQCQSASHTEYLRPEDVVATLTHFTAKAASAAIQNWVSPSVPTVVYVSGGGARNRFLMSLLNQYLGNIPVKGIEVLGVSAEAKEAVLFAILANETVAAPTPILGASEGIPSVRLGKISFPD